MRLHAIKRFESVQLAPALVLLLGASSVLGQAPCANCSGSPWTANGSNGQFWVDTPGDGSVTGVYKGPLCGQTINRTVTGNYNPSTGQFTWIGINPVPSSIPGCIVASTVTASARMISGGCNTTTTGSWINSLGDSGSFSAVKNCDKPNSETSYFDIWADGQGDPTIGIFIAQVNADRDFAGRTVREEGGLTTDGCHFTGSAFAKYSIGTAEWFLDDTINYNAYGYDNIGFFSQAVQYYRSMGRAPCTAVQPQKMYIRCNSSTDLLYHQNTVAISVGVTDISVQRGNAYQSRVWP